LLEVSVNDPKPSKQPSSITPSTKQFPGKIAIMPENAPSQESIRLRAYELYEKRGRESGRQEQDWLRAEQEILSQKR
jgi:hypothetical protein